MKVNYWHPYEEQKYYHVYNRSSHHLDLFRDTEYYDFFLRGISRYMHCCFAFMAYCLMPNHYHFIVREKREDTIKANLKNQVDSRAKKEYVEGDRTLDQLIQDQYRRMNSSYSLRYNKKYKNRGQLFLNRHKRVLFDPKEKLKYLICYVHHNPIHHKFTKFYENWEYSSFQDYTAQSDNVFYQQVINIFGDFEKFQRDHQKFQIQKLLEEEF